jgi:hypothetical protein
MVTSKMMANRTRIVLSLPSMRVAMKMLEANRDLRNATKKSLGANLQLDETTKELAVQTRSLIGATRGVARATWGVVLITLATQIALIYLAATHK